MIGWRAGALLPAALAVLGAGAMPVVLCHAPGEHLATETALAGCAPAGAPVGAQPASTSGAFHDACGAGAVAAGSSGDCRDQLLALNAVLQGPDEHLSAAADMSPPFTAVTMAAAARPRACQVAGSISFQPPRFPVLRS